MKIQFWQQFSSNHSSSYTVIGRFPDVEQAQAAVDSFRELFRGIEDWRNRPENHDLWFDEHFPPLTPVEIEFQRKYQVDWGEFGIDFRPLQIEDLTEQIGSDVLVTSGGDTNTDAGVIKRLMHRFGGKVYLQDGETFRVVVTLTCDFADDAQAEAVFHEAEAYFVDQRGKRTPWEFKEGYAMLNHGIIERNGQFLLMECVYFHIEVGLPAMLTWLQNRGAVKIDYSLNEVYER